MVCINSYSSRFLETFVLKNFFIESVNCWIGIRNAPVGPKWHDTLNPNRCETKLKPLSSSKWRIARQCNKNGKESKNGASAQCSSSKSAGRRMLPRTPKLHGIHANCVVHETLWTLLNWWTSSQNVMGSSGGWKFINLFNVLRPIAIRWHPVSIVAQPSSSIIVVMWKHWIAAGHAMYARSDCEKSWQSWTDSLLPAATSSSK